MARKKRDVLTIPRRTLYRYSCAWCDGKLNSIAQTGCQSLFGTREEKQHCNTHGNGRLFTQRQKAKVNP